MNDFIKMDIFFFVSTIAVAVVTLLIILILIRIYRILGHVEAMSKMISDEGVLLRKDISEFRTKVREEGIRFSGVLGSFRGFIQRIFIKKRNNKKI